MSNSFLKKYSKEGPNAAKSNNTSLHTQLHCAGNNFSMINNTEIIALEFTMQNREREREREKEI